MTKTEINDVRRHLTAISEAGRRELQKMPDDTFAAEAVTHADAALACLLNNHRCGWHNPASAENGKKGGRPRKAAAVK